MSVKENDTYFFFEAFLYLHPENGVRITKLERPAGVGERRCALDIRVPRAAFEQPDYKIEIGFEQGDDPITDVSLEQQLRDHLSDAPMQVILTKQEHSQ